MLMQVYADRKKTIYLDETGINLNLSPNYKWQIKGKEYFSSKINN